MQTQNVSPQFHSPTHLLEGLLHRRRRLKTVVIKPQAMCVTDSADHRTTTQRSKVTCAECLRLAKQYPIAERR